MVNTIKSLTDHKALEAQQLPTKQLKTKKPRLRAYWHKVDRKLICTWISE